MKVPPHDHYPNNENRCTQAYPPLPADLDAAVRRLKLAVVRRLAPEVLLTAKTQRWTPEELLRAIRSWLSLYVTFAKACGGICSNLRGQQSSEEGSTWSPTSSR
jgi:hypothetical protein